jgi:hypothetical protein
MQATMAAERTEMEFQPFLTSVLDGDEWSAICLGLFTLEVPFEQRAGWVSQRVWIFWRIFLPLSGEEPRGSHQLSGHTTNYAVLASIQNNELIFNYYQ